ncbi:MAG: beta/gamma crystallin-related protein [Caldimonas sp.]
MIFASTGRSAAWLAGFTLMAASQAAQSAEMTLYEHSGFAGAQLTLRGYTPSIGATGFNDRASSIVVSSGRWEVCSDIDFKGACTTLSPGEYASLPGLNDRISSAREIGSNADRRGSYQDYGRGSIQLFGQPGFAGRTLTLDADAPTLSRSDFNDRASSVVVTAGTWELCTDSNFRGD